MQGAADRRPAQHCTLTLAVQFGGEKRLAGAEPLLSQELLTIVSVSGKNSKNKKKTKKRNHHVRNGQTGRSWLIFSFFWSFVAQLVCC